MQRISAHMVALAAAAALVLAGCGEDEELSKAEIIAKGDALCKELNAEVEPKFDAIFAEFPNVDMAKAKAEFPEIVQAFDEFEGAFADLEGPAADKEAIDTIKADNEKIGGVLDKAGAGAEQGDEAAFKKTMFDAFPLFDASDERARAYGFEVCGEGDDEGDEGDEHEGPAPALSAEQEAFVRQADALCEQANEQIDPKLGPVFAGNLEEAVPAIRQILLLEQDLVAKLRALTPPKGDEANVKGLIDTHEQAVNHIDSLLRAAEARDKAAYDAAFKQVSDSFDASEEAFEEYGFEECGN